MPFYGPFALGEVGRPAAERRFREQVPNISGFSMDMPRNTLGFSSETPGLFGAGPMPSTFGAAIGALPQPTNPLGLSPKVGMFEGTSARPESVSAQVDAGGETGGVPGGPPGEPSAPGFGPSVGISVAEAMGLDTGLAPPDTGPSGVAPPGPSAPPGVASGIASAVAAAMGVPAAVSGAIGLGFATGFGQSTVGPTAGTGVTGPSEEGPATTGLGLGPAGVAEGAAAAASPSGLSAEASAAQGEQGQPGEGAGEGGEGTVICTELYRQGRLDASVYRADEQFGAWVAHDAPEVLAGYHVWAPTVVRCMARSRIVSAVVAVLARPWAREMARCIDPQRERGSLIGAVMMALGWRLCEWLGRQRVHA